MAVTSESAASVSAPQEAEATLNVFDGVEMMLGTWAWGTDSQGTMKSGPNWGTEGNKMDDNKAALSVFLAHGGKWLDTAQIYSFGGSETVIGNLLKPESEGGVAGAPNVMVATKFVPLPWRIFQSSLRDSLLLSLGRLRRPYVDLYQVHSPAFSLRAVEVWAEGMAQCVKEGLCKHVGVSNYSSDQVARTHAMLAKYGIKLASNQIDSHKVETGLIEKCKALGVKVLAYSPLAMGRLTGKYASQEALGTQYKVIIIILEDKISDRNFGKVGFSDLEKLITVMRRIGVEQGGKTPAQVAINWVVCKGAVPITGAKNATQANDNVGAMGWRLTPQQVEDLDAASIIGTSSMWQGSTQ